MSFLNFENTESTDSQYFRCNFPGCNRFYKTQRGYDNHVIKMHHLPPVTVNEHIPTLPNITEAQQPKPSVTKEEENQGWNKDQIELAMQMSMKEQYKDFIPNDEEVLEMTGQKLCSVCASKKADVAFIDCGHMVTCIECATKLKNDIRPNRRCPMCRKEIKKLLKIYT